VLHEGTVTGILDRSEADPNIIMQYAVKVGSKDEDGGDKLCQQNQ